MTRYALPLLTLALLLGSCGHPVTPHVHIIPAMPYETGGESGDS